MAAAFGYAGIFTVAWFLGLAVIAVGVIYLFLIGIHALVTRYVEPYVESVQKRSYA